MYNDTEIDWSKLETEHKKEIKSKIQELRNLLPSPELCGLCGHSIIVEENHNYFHNKKLVHKECWMTSIGDEIEKHPLGYLPPRML